MRAKTMKKALAMLLVLLLAVSLLPGSVLATSSPGAPFANVVTDSNAGVSISYEGTVSFTAYNTYTNVPHYHVTVPTGTTSVNVTYNDTALSTNSTDTAYGYFADIPGWSGGNADVTCTITQANGVTSTVLTIPLNNCPVTLLDYTPSTRSFLYTNGSGAAFAPKLDSSGNYAPVNFFTFSYSSNLPPVVVSNASETDTVTVNTEWSIDIADYFTDPENDTMTYSAKVDGVTQTLTGSILSYTPTTTGQKNVVITASDGTGSTNHLIRLNVSPINHAPRLIDSSNTTHEDNAYVGVAYVLTSLQSGGIFVDDDGDTLDFTSYYYLRSTDQINWSDPTYFEAAQYGPTIMQITENTIGTYYYEFHCTDGTAVSEDTWTLTLDVTEIPNENISFYVGKDQNYDANSTYPLIKLYKTAGFDSNQKDYIASYTISGTTYYMYTTDGYDISGSANNYVVTINNVDYPLSGYEPITFTTSDFTGIGPEGGTLNGTFNMFYARIPIGRYSFRAYGKPASGGTDYSVYLGGHSLELPAEANQSGTGGGTNIYLRLNSVYVSSKKANNTYFGANDYYAKVYMPVANGYAHSGTAYTYNTNYAAYPFMLYSVGNASIFDIYAYPTDTDNYVFNQSINNTTDVGYSVVYKSITISQAATLTVTVPANGSFKLFYQYNNYNTQEIAPAAENGNTLTFKIAKSSSNYTWRLTDTTGAKVTKAGYLASTTTDVTFAPEFSTYTNANDAHDFDHLGTTVINRDEAEIQVYLSDSGFASVSGTKRIRAYRLWQIINSDTANIMIEPDFKYQLLDGTPGDITQTSGGNAQGNWIDVTPTDTDIVAVSYKAIEILGSNNTAGTHGGLFPATNPERTAVFIVTNEAAGSAEATIEYNSNGAASSRPENWDYNYDNWFYLDADTDTLDFKVTGASVVDYGVVKTTSALTSTLTWYTTPLTADGNDYYHASLSPFADTDGGTVIIRMKDGSNRYSYRLVRVAEVTATVTNLTVNNGDIMPGHNIKVQFEGSYRGIYKYSGIFNPTTYYLRYTADETEFSTSVAQYQQMDKANLTVTIPRNTEFGENDVSKTLTLTNGYTFGSMYSAPSPFATLYNMTDTGVGTNFNAVTVSFCLNRFPEIPVTVKKPNVCNTSLNVTDATTHTTLTGYTATITDPEGLAYTPLNSGVYQLAAGDYDYELFMSGYKPARGSFTIGSTDVNGSKTIDIDMETLPANAWDGATKTAATLSNGYYEIDSGAKLAWFADQVNSGNYTINGRLTADIDLAGFAWTPIGGNSSTTAYKGIFDGNSKAISGLYINYKSTATTAPYIGLFGYVSAANIHHLTVSGLVNATSTASVSNAYCGGVAAYADSTSTLAYITSNVTVSVTRVSGNWSNVGGIVGKASGTTTINRCINNGAVTGYQYTGGVTGYTDSNVTVTNCGNTGAVTGGNYTAGVAGRIAGTVATSFNTGAVSGLNYVGGITGYNAKAISACYNQGAITGTGNYVAGITAYAYSANGGVSNCYNTGTISGGTYKGAVVGYINNSSASMQRLNYLSTSCSTGIGRAANTSTQKATSRSITVLMSSDFVDIINVGITSGTFVYMSGSYPLLSWQNS